MANEYFSHDFNSRNDRKAVALIHDFKAAGYGIYWGIVEMLHEEGGYLEADEITYIAIAKNLEADIEVVRGVIQKGISTYKLFTLADGKFTSARVLRNGDKRQEIKDQRSNAGKSSAAKRNGPTVQHPLNKTEQTTNDRSTVVEQSLNDRSTAVEQNATVVQQRKGKEIKVNKRKGNTLPKSIEPKPPLATPPASPEQNNGIGGKQPEPYWKELVEVYAGFVKEKFGEPPLLAGEDPKFLKNIVVKLKKRAGQKSVEWTQAVATERLKMFLQHAFKDKWLAEHFILRTLDSKFEEIGRDPKAIAEKVKEQAPPCTEQDLEYLYSRHRDGELNRNLVTTAHFDLLFQKGLISIGQEIRMFAKAERMDQLVGTNMAPERRLYEAYDAHKTADQSAEIKADIPKLHALEKRCAVRGFLEDLKKNKAEKIFDLIPSS